MRSKPNTKHRPIRRSATPNGHTPREGQALVEFALLVPVLLVIMLMTLDFGHLFLGWVNLQNTARIGADFAATHPLAWDATNPDAAAQARYAQLISNDATTINCRMPSPIPTPTFPDGETTINGRAQVNLTCDFQVLTPIIGGIVGSPLKLGAQAIFPIRAGIASIAPVIPTPTPSPTATPTPTPTPTPSSSAGATPTPAPTPKPPCVVPSMMGSQPNNGLQTAWSRAGFTIPFNVTVGTKFIGSEYWLDSSGGQHPGLYDGSVLPCDVEFTVGP